jgi:hypothetical protein
MTLIPSILREIRISLPHAFFYLTHNGWDECH